MDPITIALGLAQFAPSLIKWLGGGPKSVAIANQAVSIAQTVTGAGTGDAALTALKADPALADKYAEAVLAQETTFQQMAVENAKDINTTMQTEAKADHWPTYFWRPFVGMVFGLNLFLATAVVIFAFWAQVFGYAGADKVLASLPAVLAQLVMINGTATPILGIASWFRGKMQANPAIPTDNRG